MDPVSILLFIILLLWSAFFSGSEIALMSLPNHKIDSFVKQKKKWAKALYKIRKNKDKLLISILIWNNLINVTTASLATKISIDIAAKSGFEQSLAIWISTWIITLLLLMFGEIFPKTFATKHAEKIGLSIAHIFFVWEKMLKPVVFLIEKFMRFLQGSKKNIIETITDEELESFIEQWKKAGIFEKGEYEKIKNMLSFYEITAEEIMTPRVEIDALDCEITVNEAIEKIMHFSHSRILIYKWSIDEISWVVRLRQLLVEQARWNGKMKLKELNLNKVKKAPITQPIHNILDTFKKSRQHIAVIMDEYGGVAWIISLEDIVEEVFGDIKDETDNEVEEITQDNNWSFIFHSHVRIEDVLEKFELDFENLNIKKNEFEWETLGYFIIWELKRFPRKGEKLAFEIKKEGKETKNEEKKQLILQVLSLDKHSISQVKVWIK